MHPNQTIRPLLQCHGQRERGAGVAGESQRAQWAAQPVKQTLGQHLKPTLVQRQPVQGVQPAEEARGQGGHGRVPVQQHPLQGVQPAEETRGQRGHGRVPAQKHPLQGVQPAEDARGQCAEPRQRVQPQFRQRAQAVEEIRGQTGEGVRPQIQRSQPAQAFEVSTPGDGVAQGSCEAQCGDPADLGWGDRRTVGHAGQAGQDGSADGRGTVAEVGGMDDEGAGEGGGEGVAVGDRPGVGEGARGRDGGGDAAQGGRVGGEGQAGGQGAGEDIAQGGGAAGGGRQGQCRDGGADGIGLAGQGGHGEGWPADDVGDGDRYFGDGDGAVAGHGMGEGGGVVGGVGVDGGGEGDGLPLEPGGGGEGQRGGAGQGVGGGDGGGQRHGVVGAGGQTHGVGGHGDFLHGERRRLDEDFGGCINRDEDVERGGLAVGILDCVLHFVVATVGVALLSGRGGGGSGHGPGGGREGQAGEACLEWLSVPEAVRQGAVSADGGWQGERRDGGADGVELTGHRGLVEGRVAAGVGDGDDDGSHVVGGIAGDRMGEGDAFAGGVVVQAGGDGDGLSEVPDVGGEEQGVGDGHGAVGGVDDGGHGHVAGGGGIEGHGVDGGGAFVHGEGGGGCNDAGSGLDELQVEVSGYRRAEAGVAEPGVGEGDGGWGGRGRAEGVAGAIAGGDGGRAALAVDGPVDHDGKRGGLPYAYLEPAVAHLHGIHPQGIGGMGVPGHRDARQGTGAVKQACGEGSGELVVVEMHVGESGHITEDPCGQGGEALAAQRDLHPD